MGIIENAKGLIYKAAYRFLYPATLVEGTLKDSETRFRCVFIGSNHYREYLMNKVYQEPAQVVWQKRLFGMAGVLRLLKSVREEVNLCVAELPQSREGGLQGAFDFKSYESVGHCLDITPSWDEIRKSFGKNPKETKRKIIKNDLSYRISKDPADFETFYHRMYMAHIRNQFGPLAQLKSYGVLREYFERGFLLLVVKGGLPIAGLVAYCEGHQLAFRDVGLLDGDKSFAQLGAQSALYYFSIQHAKLLGLKAIDLRSSYPFPNDGVYRHKREWGSTISRNDSLSSAVYFFLTGSAADAALFFEAHPMVVSVDERLGVLLGQAAEAMSDDPNFRKKLVDKFGAPGLDAAYVLTAKTKTPRKIPLHV